MAEKTDGGADKHLPDGNAEKIPEPKVGQIWRQDLEGHGEPGFYRIMNIKNPDDPERKKYSVIRIDTVSRKRTGKAINVGPLRLKNKYTFAAETEEVFFTNLSPEDKKKRQGPIRAFEELGEPLPPVVEETTTLSTPGGEEPEELLLEDVIEEEKTGVPPSEDLELPEEEKEVYSTQQIEGVIRTLLLSNDKVQNIDQLEIKGGDGVMTLRIKMKVKTPPFVSGEVLIDAELNNTKDGIAVSNYSINANPLVKSALEKELVPRLSSVSSLLSQYIEDRSGKKVNKIEIDEKGELTAFLVGQAAGANEQFFPSSTPEEGEARIASPQDAGDTPERPNLPPTEETYEEYERQKAILEESLSEARLKFVQDDYEYTTQTNKLTSLLRLTPDVIPSRESAYALEYGTALKNLRDHEFTHLQQTLSTLPANEQKERIESFLLRYRYQEAIDLHTSGKEVASLAENESLAGKIKNSIKELGNGYRKLSFVKKMALTAGVVGVGMVAAGGVGALTGVASVAYVAKRAVSGAAGYLAIDEGVNKYLSKKSEKKAKKETSELAHSLVNTEMLQNMMGDQAEAWQKLLDVTNEKITDFEKDLQKLKVRENRIKMGAFAAAIGLPFAGHALGLFEGPSGNEEVVGSTNLPPSSDDFVTATDHVETGTHPSETGGSTALPEVTPETNVAPMPEPMHDISEAPAATATPPESPGPIGFRDSPLSPEERYWQDIRNGQGTYRDSVQVRPDSYESHPGSYYHHDTEPREVFRSGHGSGGEGINIQEPTPEPTLDEAAPQGPETQDMVNHNDATELTDQSGHGDTGSESEVKVADSSNHDTDTPDNADTLPEETNTAAPLEQSETHTYSVEESRYQSLTESERPVWRESMTDLRTELLDINHSEFGPNYTPTHWQSDQLWALNKDNSVQDLIAFDNPQYNYDPRDYSFREPLGRRGIYLPPIHPEPGLGDGPDARAIYTMDQIKGEYRHNIALMHRAAVERFGSVAHPIGRGETVQQYMSRIATLYTRARMENPNFRLKF